MLTVLLLCCCRCCCCCSAVAGGQIASTAPATGANLSCHKNVQQLATKQTMRRVPTAATTTTTRPAATAATATTAAMAAFSNCANKLLLHFTFILRVRMRVVFSALPSSPSPLLVYYFFLPAHRKTEGLPPVSRATLPPPFSLLLAWPVQLPPNLHFTIVAGFIVVARVDCCCCCG